MVSIIFFTAVLTKFSNIGSAVLEPVIFSLGLSAPIYTPITKLDVKPINQVSVFLFVVPVFPAIFKLNL